MVMIVSLTHVEISLDPMRSITHLNEPPMLMVWKNRSILTQPSPAAVIHGNAIEIYTAKLRWHRDSSQANHQWQRRQ